MENCMSNCSAKTNSPGRIGIYKTERDLQPLGHLSASANKSLASKYPGPLGQGYYVGLKLNINIFETCKGISTIQLRWKYN